MIMYSKNILAIYFLNILGLSLEYPLKSPAGNIALWRAQYKMI